MSSLLVFGQATNIPLEQAVHLWSRKYTRVKVLGGHWRRMTEI